MDTKANKAAIKSTVSFFINEVTLFKTPPAPPRLLSFLCLLYIDAAYLCSQSSNNYYFIVKSVDMEAALDIPLIIVHISIYIKLHSR